MNLKEIVMPDAEYNENIFTYYFNNIYGRIYNFTMKISHKYHWHYAPPIYPNGDTQLWCQWCGFRHTIKKHTNKEIIMTKAKKGGGRAGT